MLSKCLVATCGMLAWLTAPAWAGTIQDPAAQIDAGSGSSPFTGAGSFTPCGDLDPNTHQCTGLIALYNATNGSLTSITLDTTINAGLDQSEIDAFTCNSSPFFIDCQINYEKSTGAFSIAFLGSPAGAIEGIPPLLPGCINHPDEQGCNIVGHFAFDFLSLGVNGWTDGNTILFPDGQTPTFGVTSTDTATPEPGTSTLLAAGVLSLALLSRRNYFSRSSRS